MLTMFVEIVISTLILMLQEMGARLIYVTKQLKSLRKMEGVKAVTSLTLTLMERLV